MTGAIIFQLFFPTYMGSHSGYGISIGWQREIGIWNVTVLVILITVNLKYDWFYLKAVLMALKKGRTSVKGMWSEKKGSTYDAVVILDDTGGKYVNFKLEFPKRKDGVHGKK